MAVKVHDVAIHGVLTPEFQASNLLLPESCPELRLGRRLLLPHPAGIRLQTIPLS
jgi:hypothetical protein